MTVVVIQPDPTPPVVVVSPQRAPVVVVNPTINRTSPFDPRVEILTDLGGHHYRFDAELCDVAIIEHPSANFTLDAPVGAPVESQPVLVKIQSLTGFTMSFDPIFIASGVAPLPSAALPSGKTATLGFMYDSLSGSWVLLAVDTTGY